MIDPRPSGLLRRLAAICYDTLIVAAILIGATAAVLPFTRGEPVSAGKLWYQLLLGAIVLAYFSISWWRRGQTIGMVAWRLRVLPDSGGQASLPQCVIRACTASISWLAAGLGFLWVLIDRKNRAWHDLLSGTKLVFEKPVSARAPARPR